ncbi:MAG: asparagine synthase (glutamine-hydrolyzing) [Gammaproteobacteria bacterium]
MCGISGIININGSLVGAEEIERINDLIKHRGPDDEGYFFEKNFAFGHRRLAIIDLTDAGHQPMHFKDRYVITFNGEIFNYVELREELKELGYVFETSTDTEVILASYDKWGKEAVSRFNGMWAFALYDRKQNIIFCSRDRFGVKPFYFSSTRSKFVFGSEIKQIIELQHQRIVNKKILADYLVTGMQQHTNETFFSGVEKLPQGCNLIFDITKGSFTCQRYYYLENEISLNGDKDKYKKLLESSIELRLRSDAPFGSLLSGGIDSSIISSISQGLLKSENKKLVSLHSKSMEKITDESAFAQQVADYCDLDLNIIKPSTDEFKGFMNEVVYTQEEPFQGPTVFMQYLVLREAKKLKLKVVLDGQGGDETLLGYPKYYVLYMHHVYKKYGIFKALKTLKIIKDNSAQSYFVVLYYLVGMSFPSLRKYVHTRQASYFKSFFLNLSDYSYLDDLAKSTSNDKEMQMVEILETNLPVLLKVEDRNSMRHSIEARLPFIDYRCVEEAISMGLEDKINEGWTKYTLRQIGSGILPKSICWRKDKIGFDAPNSIWMDKIDKSLILKSRILADVSDMNLLLKKFDKLTFIQQWRLINVAIWEEVYDVKVG